MNRILYIIVALSMLSCSRDAQTICETYIQDHSADGAYAKTIYFKKTDSKIAYRQYRMVVNFDADWDDYNCIYDFRIKRGKIILVKNKGIWYDPNS